MECFLPWPVLQYLLGIGADTQCYANLSVIPGRFVEAYDPKLYMVAFSLTVLLEWPVYRHFFGSTKFGSWVRAGVAVLFLNLATHPLIILGLPQFWARAEWAFGSYAGFSEILAPTLEMFFLRFILGLDWRRSAIAAFAANLVSWWLGGLIAGQFLRLLATLG